MYFRTRYSLKSSILIRIKWFISKLIWAVKYVISTEFFFIRKFGFLIEKRWFISIKFSDKIPPPTKLLISTHLEKIRISFQVSLIHLILDSFKKSIKKYEKIKSWIFPEITLTASRVRIWAIEGPFNVHREELGESFSFLILDG